MSDVVSNCTECRNGDSFGLPDRPICKECVAGSKWVPLNASSVNRNLAAQLTIDTEVEDSYECPVCGDIDPSTSCGSPTCGLVVTSEPEQMEFCGGKYTVINDRGVLSCLRHGQPWERDLVGDNLVYWMFVESIELQHQRDLLLRALRNAVEQVPSLSTDTTISTALLVG